MELNREFNFRRPPFCRDRRIQAYRWSGVSFVLQQGDPVTPSVGGRTPDDSDDPVWSPLRPDDYGHRAFY